MNMVFIFFLMKSFVLFNPNIKEMIQKFWGYCHCIHKVYRLTKSNKQIPPIKILNCLKHFFVNL
jgi:hypothetical protein